MKKGVVLFFCLLIGSKVLLSQNDPFAPIITFVSDTHDYGTIKQGSDGTCEFKFTNTGKDPLFIDKVEAPCACVVTKWPKRAIRKGKTGVIKVQYYTKRLGPIDKTLTIKSNSQNGDTAIKLKGTVEGG